jgi:hypothetical protein
MVHKVLVLRAHQLLLNKHHTKHLHLLQAVKQQPQLNSNKHQAHLISKIKIKLKQTKMILLTKQQLPLLLTDLVNKFLILNKTLQQQLLSLK